MKHSIYILGAILAFFCFAACEDMEETYDDFVGDGPVRYLAKCKGVEVLPGWNRLIVNWTNQLDGNRNGIYIECESDFVRIDTVVGAADTTCSIPNLPDGTYNVEVRAISDSGDTSLIDAPVTGRPYTIDHEAVFGYTRGYAKSIFLKNNVVFFTNRRSSDMIEFIVNYTKTDGTPGEYDLTANMNDENLRIEDVNTELPVTLHRRGLLENCPDTIDFPEVEITHQVALATDFSVMLAERYGTSSDPALFQQAELDLDYDLESLEDILYFPNLTTLNLDKNRYNQYYSVASTYNYDYEERRDFCLNLLAEVNPDFRVKCCGYSPYGVHAKRTMPWGDVEGFSFADDMGDTQLPADVVPLDTTGFGVSIQRSSQTDPVELAEEDVRGILDGTYSTYWRALPVFTSGTTEVVIDMGAAKNARGIMFTQANITNYMERGCLPTSLNVATSTDGRTWVDARPSANNTIGNNPGEQKLVEFMGSDGTLETRNIRYIRIRVTEGYVGESAQTAIGSIQVF